MTGVKSAAKKSASATKTRTGKAKGRRFQQLVRDTILDKFPSLDPSDVRSTSMGAGGEDIQLSSAARKLFPFSVECKARNSIAVCRWYDQAKANSEGHEPLLVIKEDRKKPLVLISLDKLMELL